MGNLECGKKKLQSQNSPLTVRTSSTEVSSTILHPQNSPMFGTFLLFLIFWWKIQRTLGRKRLYPLGRKERERFYLPEGNTVLHAHTQGRNGPDLYSMPSTNTCKASSVMMI